jgi:hypothetical protein
VRAAGWQIVRTRSHGYVDTGSAHYMLTLVDRGADALAVAGAVTADAAEALKEEPASAQPRGLSSAKSPTQA